MKKKITKAPLPVRGTQTGAASTVKTRRNVTVSPEVWKRAQAKSKRTGIALSFKFEQALVQWLAETEPKGV